MTNYFSEGGRPPEFDPLDRIEFRLQRSVTTWLYKWATQEEGKKDWTKPRRLVTLGRWFGLTLAQLEEKGGKGEEMVKWFESLSEEKKMGLCTECAEFLEFRRRNILASEEDKNQN